ncbi:type inositol 1,4,5-trisphosphate phosphatase [Salix suchowensis]|nr:type inositol 1,4,5-trisphosphate phosphatase [Salix suchowensis]
MIDRRGSTSKLKRKQMDSMDHNTHHEGIKTLKVNKVCNFSGNSDLCICVVTWNMNGQVVYEDLVELVGSNSKCDLLVVGLQEVPRKNIAPLLQTALADTHVLLGKAIMQSLQLYVFGTQNSGIFIKELKVDKHSVGGCGGLIGRKKGAVAIRVERNSQCRHISHSLFSKHRNPYSKPAQVTVWLGDLNYRIQGIKTHPVRNLIQKNLHRLLTGKDQLLQEAERGQVRVPSWTDRILFKIQDMEEIRASLHSYESVDDIHSSDHKPVKAHLCLKVNEQP